jgi:3-oxoacyl-[acyl-carrier protein] reductase
VTPTAGLTGQAGLVPYVTAVEGIRAMAKSAARQWGRDRITVNCVAPPIELMVEGHDAPAGGPLGRAPSARQDVAAAIALLAGDQAAFVTGATIVVDGGIVMAP